MGAHVSDLEVSVVVPARNAAQPGWASAWNPSAAEHPREIIVVDGCSTDDTAEIARSLGRQRHLRRGPRAARGADARRRERLLRRRGADRRRRRPSAGNACGGLLDEFEAGGYDGLQFGLASEADGPGYWGAALAWHHNHSRVRSWFGVCATLMRRKVLLSVASMTASAPARTSS